MRIGKPDCLKHSSQLNNIKVGGNCISLEDEAGLEAQKILERTVSIQKTNPTIRRPSEDRPLDARKLGHSSSRGEVRKRFLDGASSADPKLKAKPIAVVALCAPESTPTQSTTTPNTNFYSTTTDPTNSKGSDALEETSLTWTERQKECCENRTNTETVKLPVSSSTPLKVASSIADRVVAQDPDRQSHKPDHSEPENYSYTRLATLIAGDSDVHTRTKERKLLAGLKVQSSGKTASWECYQKNYFSALPPDAATRRSGSHRDTSPIKPRQIAQEPKQTQVCPNPLNNSKSNRPKGGAQRATNDFNPSKASRMELQRVGSGVVFTAALIKLFNRALGPNMPLHPATTAQANYYHSWIRAAPTTRFTDRVIRDTEDELTFYKMRNRCKSEIRQWNIRKQATILDLARKNRNVLCKYMRHRRRNKLSASSLRDRNVEPTSDPILVSEFYRGRHAGLYSAQESPLHPIL
ncbi:hypothetical protein CLF_104274 [Clonorchis sinensis]|uniref:Uncharacterized protein n=1 Tax=Clonorchis sinensis TaxID=79923 RepID=G7YBA6_CLOSI|nr:hypothetical protein CLF_104274 [Clonorchis sinensis]